MRCRSHRKTIIRSVPLAAVAIIVGVAPGADYAVRVVDPPVNNHLILRDGPLPPVCKDAKTVELRACRGQYGPASFVVDSAGRLEGVTIEVGQLIGPAGKLPPDAVDVRVVKDYYRYTVADGYNAAIPTLLVHDEGFLAIEPDPTEKDPDRMKNVARGPLRDAPKLLPVTVEKRKQFWITVHVPDHARPGKYEGKLRIVPKNGDASALTLRLDVYPFDLLPPMTEYSIYYPAYLEIGFPVDHNLKFGDLTAEQYLAELKNMVAHGLTNPNIFDGPKKKPDRSLDFSKLDRVLDLRERAGMRPKSLYLLGHAAHLADRPLTPKEREETHKSVRQTNEWATRRGYEQVYYAAADEWWGERLSREADSMRAIREAGGKVYVAVMHTTFFDRVGDVLDCPVVQAGIGAQLTMAMEKYDRAEALARFAEIAKAGSFARTAKAPKFRKAIDGAHRLGHKVFTYMNPVGGMPLPELQRRNEGLGLWRVGFDGTMTWAYTHNGCKDRAAQPMHFAKVFRTDGGVLDTLHWEGFREGVDDVRYLTTLLAALRAAAGRFPRDPLVADTFAWIGGIDAASGDLDAIRAEMARRIIALNDLGYRQLTPQQVLAGLDLDKIKIVTLPEPWAFKIDTKDDGVAGKWFDPGIDDSQWAKIRSDKELGWDKQGFGGDQTVGYGWYRARLPLGAEDAARKAQYLYFEAVDEDAWVYVNGRQLFEHSVESTGMPPSEIWLTPFSVSLEGAELRGADLLTVRVHNGEAMGGVWKPVHLVVSDRGLTPDQLQALVGLRQKDTEAK